MKTTIELWNDEAQEFEPVELPAKYEVCDSCNGNGTQCALGAMTGDEYRELCDGDPDFPEDYKRGVYSTQCACCKGLRVVAVVDEDRIDKAMQARLDAHYREQAEDAAERADQLRYGY